MQTLTNGLLHGLEPWLSQEFRDIAGVSRACGTCPRPGYDLSRLSRARLYELRCRVSAEPMLVALRRPGGGVNLVVV